MRPREVADGVLVSTSRLMQTNSTLLLGGDEVMLVDPAWLPDELEGLAAFVKAKGLRVISGFATHAHHDHLLWHPEFGDVPRWASSATADAAVHDRESLVGELKGVSPVLLELMGRVTALPVGSRRLPAESVPRGLEIELITHNAHAPGHTALWLPQARVLIAGDMLSDVELPLPFDPDDVAAYLDGLDRLTAVAARAEVVIPGHGSVGVDASARLDADRRYLDQVLRFGRSDDPRQANPGMHETHERIVSMLRGRPDGAEPSG